jgi:hypothetical protein
MWLLNGAVPRAWAALAQGATLYLYGIRVRGDHRTDSDVDVCFDWHGPFGDTDLQWWAANNQEDFAAINAKLSCKLRILETNDPLKHEIVAAPVIHQDRNVRCVLLPPKSHGGA